jgi:hypothetical protein
MFQVKALRLECKQALMVNILLKLKLDVLVYSFVGMNEITRTVGATSSVNVTMQDGKLGLN